MKPRGYPERGSDNYASNESSYQNTQQHHLNPYQPQHHRCRLVDVASLLFGFVICPDVPFPVLDLNLPVIKQLPLTELDEPLEEPKDTVGILDWTMFRLFIEEGEGSWIIIEWVNECRSQTKESERRKRKERIRER